MANEIERKFKVEKLPKELLEHIIPLELTQTYLKSPEGEERRVRSINNETFVMTVKRPKSSDGLVREEIEKEISREDYELFLHSKIGTQIKKSRYKIPGENGLVYELDIYDGELKGLKVVEVEFTDTPDFTAEELANKFEKPHWFGREVTANKEYKNSSLAKNGMPKDCLESPSH